MKQVELKLGAAELIILSAVVLMITRGYRYDRQTMKYHDHDVSLPVIDKKLMAALRSIARKLGVK